MTKFRARAEVKIRTACMIEEQPGMEDVSDIDAISNYKDVAYNSLLLKYLVNLIVLTEIYTPKNPPIIYI